MVEHDEQGQAHRIGQQRLLLRVEVPVRGDDRVGQVPFERNLPVAAAGAQHVQALSGDDGGQPSAEVVDLLRLGSAQPYPGVLDGVFGLGQRTKHSIGHRLQPGPVLLEALSQPLGLVHHSHYLVARAHRGEPADASNVTSSDGEAQLPIIACDATASLTRCRHDGSIRLPCGRGVGAPDHQYLADGRTSTAPPSRACGTREAMASAAARSSASTTYHPPTAPLTPRYGPSVVTAEPFSTRTVVAFSGRPSGGPGVMFSILLRVA